MTSLHFLLLNIILKKNESIDKVQIIFDVQWYIKQRKAANAHIEKSWNQRIFWVFDQVLTEIIIHQLKLLLISFLSI